MNKTQLTVFIISLVLCLGGSSFYSTNHKHRSIVQAQSHAAANGLINSNYASLFVSIGTGFKESWERFAKDPVRIEAVRTGDEPAPIGDGQASSRAFFVNEAKERLAIRMRWDGEQQKFHILGFWTPENSQ